MAKNEQVGGTQRYCAEANLFKTDGGAEVLHASVQLPEGTWDLETQAEPGDREFLVRLWHPLDGMLHYEWKISCPTPIDPGRGLEMELLEDGILFIEIALAAASALADPALIRRTAAA